MCEWILNVCNEWMMTVMNEWMNEWMNDANNEGRWRWPNTRLSLLLVSTEGIQT